MQSPPSATSVSQKDHSLGEGQSLAGRLSGRRLGRRWEDVAAITVYLLAWLLLLGRQGLADPAHICVCNASPDATAYMWALVWWPHALFHGLNPFVSHVIWVPGGANLAAAAMVPWPSLLLSPITAAFGPIVAYNLLSLLGPVLAAWFAFRLCRYVTGGWLPSLVGGYLFGFSTYELVHLTSTPNLSLIFLVPAAVHLALLWIHERIGSRRFVAWLTVILTLQVGLSTEILLTMIVFGVSSLFLAYVFSGSAHRRRIAAMVPKVLFAGVATCVLVSPYLYYAIKGLAAKPGVDWRVVGNINSADPLSYLLPTSFTWVGHGLVTSLAMKFNRNPYEGGAYLGLPIAAIVSLFLLSKRREQAGKVLLGVLVLLVIASLGPHLHIANLPQTDGLTYKPSIPLPWLIVSRLLGFNHVVPGRLAMYVSLVAGIIVAMWLALPAKRQWSKWLLAGAGLLLIVPNVAGSYWSGRPDDPQFFSNGAYRHYLRPGETVLILPFGYLGSSMLWQAQSNIYFRMAEGYVSAEVPPDYRRDPIALNLMDPVRWPIAPARLPLALRSFVMRRHVGAIIVDPTAFTAWPSLLTSFGLSSTRLGGVILYPIPAGWKPLHPTVPLRSKLRPMTVQVSPANGATGVSPNARVNVVFSQPMEHAATQGAFSLVRSAGGGVVQGRLLWFTDKVLVFEPANQLAHGTQYTATVGSTAKDQYGRTLANRTSWRFITS